MPTRLGAPLLMPEKRPNIALYTVIAIVIIVLGTYGIIGFLASRGNDETAIVTGLLAWGAPTVAGLIAMLVAVKNQEQTANVQKQVNGTLTKFADQAVEAQTQSKLLEEHVAHLEDEVLRLTPERGIPPHDVAKGPPR